mgnify:FL=1
MDNKSKIIEVIKSYYGDNEVSDDELKSIEKIAQDDKNTQDLIDILTKSKGRKASDSRNIKEGFLLNTIKMLGLRSNSTTNQNTKENIDKIMEATNEYFDDNKVDFTEKQKDLINSVAKFDDATNNLVKWLDDAVQNDEERNIKNYFIEVMDAYEDQLSINESKEFVEQLKKLNPDVDIKLSDDYNSIDISKSINELNMPETFYVDENNFITNKENTALSVYVSLKVNEKNNNITKGKNNMKSEERKEKIIIDNDFLKKEPKKRKKSKFRKFKKFILTVGTKIFKVSRYITNKFVSIKDYLEEEMTINVTKDNNIIKSSDIDENVKYNNKNIENDIENNRKNTINNKDNNIKDTNDKTTKQTPQNIKKCFTEISNSMSSNENVDSINKQMDTLFHQITHEKDDITRRKLSDKYFDLSNRLEILKQQLKEEQSLKSDKIDDSISLNEKIDNINKRMDTLFHQITHEKDDITRRKLSDKYFDLSNRLEILKQQLKEEQSLKSDKIDDSISLNEKIDNINKRMDTLFHQITHEKDDITRRKLSDKYFDLSNQLDAINIKLNLLKQKREEIVAENPMTHARTM